MEISDIRIRIINKEDAKLKAVASVIIDNAIAIHDIKILEHGEDYLIAMPCRKTYDNKYIDVVHPINAETRALLSNAILEQFHIKMQEEN